MIFQPDTYYVGDPGFVLPSDDLRMLFAQSMHGELKSGARDLLASRDLNGNGLVCDYYWLAVTPCKRGTLYSQDGGGWGVDWGCFGLIRWKWLDCSGSYESNKIKFTEPFECSFTEDSITIGHLHFTLNPK